MGARSHFLANVDGWVRLLFLSDSILPVVMVFGSFFGRRAVVALFFPLSVKLDLPNLGRVRVDYTPLPFALASRSLRWDTCCVDMPSLSTC